MLNDKRKKRVKRLKRLILMIIACLIFIPAALCVYLGIRVHSLQSEVASLTSELKTMEISAQNQESAEAEQHKEVTEVDSIRKWEQAQKEQETKEQQPVSGIRKVCLTFDDGPSIYTDQILDILKEYNVKATFFVVGKGKEPYEDEYRRILMEGHTLGMHSYSHVYQDIYSSKEAFIGDINKLQEYLHEVTGVYPQIYRFPGGSGNHAGTVDMQELTDYLAEIDVTYYDWNVSSGDATGKKISSDQIIANCTDNLENYRTAVILLHDAADKKSTVEALPGLIEKILSFPDTVIVPITDDIVPVQQRESK